jgi:DHA1 family bicyclomycin/chloramphenicol resistance-like MFS transporter
MLESARLSAAHSKYEQPPRSLIVVLAMFVATVPLALDMYLPGLPGIAAELGVDEGEAAHTVSAFLFGLALGQLLMGPLSDRYGRRAILALSLSIYTAASVACALATGIGQLVVFRILEAFGAGAAAVIVNALVRDMFEERASASVMSFVFMVMLMAPLFAPIIGGHLLEIAGWRLIFWVLSAYGAICIVVNMKFLPAQAPRTHAPTAVELLRALAQVFAHRESMGYNLAASLAGAALFAFIAGSSFFYIEVYGVAPSRFGYLFAVNVITLMLVSSVNRVLVHRRPLRTLILAGGVMQVVASSVLALGVWSGSFPLPAAVACLAVAIGSMGFVNANGTTAMLGYFPQTTGTTAAVGGISRFLFGAFASSAVGVLNGGGGRSMVAVMAGCAVAGVISLLLLTDRPRPA